MDKRLYFWALMVLFGSAAYLLYRKGAAVTKSIRAILFVFRPGRNADTITLNSCTGWVQHVGRFRESRIYAFTFDAQLSKGDAAVSLLDQDKRQLCKLDRQSSAGNLALDKSRRYYLRWEFKHASGKCELRWQ